MHLSRTKISVRRLNHCISKLITLFTQEQHVQDRHEVGIFYTYHILALSITLQPIPPLYFCTPVTQMAPAK